MEEIDVQNPPKEEENKGNFVYLTASNGDKRKVSLRGVEMSRLIKEMLEEDGDDEIPDIPLPNVEDDTLEPVIQFMEKHANDPMPEIQRPLKSANMADCVGAWDAQFIEVEQSKLFKIILAANYLDIPSLLDLGCAKVASMIKGKTPEEIRKTFNIVNDFTPEEEEQVKVENKWCEEQVS